VPAQANNLALLMSRLLIASLFLPSGIGKLWNLGPFTAMLRDKGVPFSSGMAIVSVATEILGPIALILGVAPRLTATVLIAFTAVATLLNHRYWTFADPIVRQAQYLNFYKNLAIIGGLFAAWAAGPGDWSLRGLIRREAPAAKKKTARR
jgi:putative oxidoreductase